MNKQKRVKMGKFTMMGVGMSDDKCKILITLSKSTHDLLKDYAGRRGAKISMLARRMIEHCLRDLELDEANR